MEKEEKEIILKRFVKNIKGGVYYSDACKCNGCLKTGEIFQWIDKVYEEFISHPLKN